MDRFRPFATAALPCLVVAVAATSVEAQATRPTMPPLAGTWTLAAVDNVLPDGTRAPLYGDAPQGRLVLDDAGRYTLQILRSDRVPFASNDKARGTADEYRAATLGTNAHFGRYAVDLAAHTITFRIEYASFPNWDGTTQTRPFTLVGDELTYTVPTPTTDAARGAVGEVRWRRVR